jgi:hypothetical protein
MEFDAHLEANAAVPVNGDMTAGLGSLLRLVVRLSGGLRD